MGYLKRTFTALLAVSIVFALYLAKGEIESYNVDEYHKRIIRQLADELGIEFQFESYRYSIFPGIEYVAVTPIIKYQDTILKAEEISVYLPISTMLLGRTVVSEIRVTEPEIKITRDKDGRWDIEPLFIAAAGGGGTGSTVKRVLIIGGGIDIVDESVPGESKKSRFDISTASFYSPGILIPARMNMTGTMVDHGRRTPASLSIKWKTGMEEMGLTGIQLDGSAKMLSLSSEYFQPYMTEAPPEWFRGKYLSASINFSGDLLKDFDFRGGISVSSSPVAEDSVAEELFSRSKNWLEFRGNLQSNKFVLNKFQLHWPMINVMGYLEVDELKGGNPHVKAMVDSSSIDITNLNILIESEVFPRVWERLFLRNIYSGRFRLRDVEYEGRINDLLDGAGGKNIGNFNGKLEIADLSLQMQNMYRPIEDINGVAAIDSEQITFNDFSARYGMSTIRNISGRVDDYLSNPTLYAVVEAELNLHEFHAELMRNIRSKKLKNALRPMKKLQGSLDFLFETKFDLVNAEVMEFEGDLQFKDISFHHAQYRFPVTSLNGTVLVDSSMIKIDDLSWYIGSSVLRADGGIVGYLGDDYVFEFTVDAAGDSAVYANSLRYFLPEVEGVKGVFGSKVEISGTLDELEFVNRLDLTDMKFRYGKIFKKPVGFLSQVYLSGTIKDQTELKVKKLDLMLGKTSVKASGYTKDISSPTEYEISLDSAKISLDELHVFANDFKKAALKGEVDGNFKIKREGGRSSHDYNFNLNLKSADLEYLKGIEFFTGMSLEGGVSGRLKVKSRSGNPIRLTGSLNASNVGFDAGLAEPILGLSGDVEFLGDRMRIVDIPARMGNSRGNISLDVKFETKPIINLQVDGREIYLNDIIAMNGEEEESTEEDGPETADDFSPDWIIGINSEKGTLGDLKYKKLYSIIRYSDDRFDFDHFNFNDYNGKFEVSGTLNTKYHQEIFDVAIKMEKVNLKLLLKDLHPESDEISGTLNLTANLTGNSLKWEKMMKNLGGDVKFTVSDGLIQQFDGVSQVFTYINILPVFKTRTEEQKGSGVPFDTFGGNFSIDEGVANTENTSIEGDILRASMVGEINFAEESLDLLIGLKPFTMIDKVVSNIPIAGNILTGKGKSLIVSYYRIGGGFDDINSEAVPAESVARTAIGIVQRLLETPARALSINDSESDKK